MLRLSEDQRRMAETIETYIREAFATHAELPAEAIYGENLTLSEVIARSQRMTNSVDLMEAFARTANGLRKDHGIRVRLPALSLDTPVLEVLAVFLAEVEAQKAPAA
jgi:hypothetical protein